MRASEDPLLLRSSGHTELAEVALDGSVVGCQPQRFSRWASSATCSRLGLPPSSRSLLLRGSPDGEHCLPGDEGDAVWHAFFRLVARL